MKSTKDLVFEFVRQNVYTNSAANARGGVETREIALALGKQRSNISAALNELIKEGKLSKTATRPVLYRLPVPVVSQDDPGAGGVIGMDGSLRTALQQGKAAIRYPKNPLNILISAKSGCGTTLFVSVLYRYAVQNCVISAEVPLVKINCRHYAKNILALEEELFGTGSGENSCFARARGGMLFIDGFDLLDARQQSRIFAFLETKQITTNTGERIDYSDVYLVLSCNSQNVASLRQKVAMTVELPELAARPLEERFALVNHFFETEARNLKRDVEVSAEAVKALLITQFSYNVKELHNEVLHACMNAYVRTDSDPEQKLTVGIGDFSANVQQSLLELKQHAGELNQLLGERSEIFYDEKLGYRSAEVAQPRREKQPAQNRPVLLYAMHGNATAQSLCAVTNALSFCDNAYGYDLSLDSDAKTAKEELKHTLQKIDRGAGVIVIYDMGSIKTLLDAIAAETDIKICALQIPITLIGIDTAQKCQEESDVDAVYHSVGKSLREQRYYNTPRSSVIITLCHTGEAGAQYLKEYIDRHSRLGIKTIALNISGRKLLLKEAMELKRTYNIHAFVGTYDPKLLGIPFIPATRLLDVEPEKVDRVLMFEPVRMPAVDYSRMYEYLQEQLKFTSVAKLKRVLPDVVDELAVMYDLDSDRMQGLFIHLACVVERILSGGQPARNPQTKQIVESLAEDYRLVCRTLRRLEKPFKIIIDDNEIATLIMILKKI